MEFLADHPFYLPFIALNIWLIYRLIKYVIDTDGKDGDDDDDQDGNGGIEVDDPVLDLPPGVSLPRETTLVEA